MRLLMWDKKCDEESSRSKSELNQVNVSPISILVLPSYNPLIVIQALLVVRQPEPLPPHPPASFALLPQATQGFQPINSNNLATSELRDHRRSPSSAKNCLPANPSSQSNPSRRATEPTESSNQPLRPDQTTHWIRKKYSADPTNIQVPGSYSAASKAESSISTSLVDDISDHLKPSSHQILRTLSCSASSEIPLNFPSSQSTLWDSSRSNTDWSPASPNPLIPPNTLNLRSDTSPQPIHSASAKLSLKLRRKASSVNMTRSG
ncbi:hypothetical protein PPACK8108_LOCUS24892 [Phakopsora pachyrhizi]|uniref:Uncharacterized protein n=1 Tax=Phakopsora pachyrhizi TaxID=170000 RepID=A0AAV0BSP1_PHAPC|nr:hypothetical protein PPACK8108_LOCUS24892 [Phakopsora pachyrhizi]